MTAGAFPGRALLARRTLRRNPLLATGLAMLAVIVLFALLAPWITPYPGDAGTATHPEDVLLHPSSAHLFGTDLVGRDLFTRVVYGARVSLLIVVTVLVLATLIGVPLGIAAGYFGGVVDQIIMRVTDVFLAFPPLLLSLALAFIFTPSVRNMTFAIAATWWPWYARLARGEAASVSGRAYIESCKALGISTPRILFRHVLPNSVTPLIVQISLDAGGVLLTAAAISFLGMGAQDPTPEWGLMVSQGAQYFSTQWWFATFPGLAILITAMAFNLVGDGLRELLDPRRVVTR
ncbi:MAG: ABC transporter permease [Gaiellales bacterium]